MKPNKNIEISFAFPITQTKIKSLKINSFKNRYLIIGAGWAGQTIASILTQKNPNSVIGFLDDKITQNHVSNISHSIPILGHSSKLFTLAKQYNIRNVIIAVTHTREDYLLNQIIKCQESDIIVHEMSELFTELTHKIPVHHINHQWITPQLISPKPSLESFFYDFINYALSFLGLIITLFVFPIIALLIKIDSKGPIFYRQERVGYRGKTFKLLKFRTMVKDADKSGAAWTFKNDRRITRVGKWLRKFRLDELPQFFNILKGEMSLIGPRPEAVELVSLFQKEIPFYEYRYLVKPGITGWAQVNHENTCSVEGALEKLQYDLYWIQKKSLLIVLKIIFKSVKVMVTGFGAV